MIVGLAMAFAAGAAAGYVVGVAGRDSAPYEADQDELSRRRDLHALARAACRANHPSNGR